MKKRLRIVLPFLVVILCAYFIYDRYKVGDDSSSLRFSGNIEVTETQLSFRIPGRLEKRIVEEGDEVKKDQLLAQIDKSDQALGVAQAEASLAYAAAVLSELEAGSRQEEIDAAEARVMMVRHTLTELERGSRTQEIESGRAGLKRARAAMQTAIIELQQKKIDFDRYAKLYEASSISKNVFETFRNLYDTADNKVKEAKATTRSVKEQLDLLEAGPRIEQVDRVRAQLKQVEAEYALVKAGPRVTTIDQAKARVTLAEKTLLQARLQLGYTDIFAPMDGVVLSVSAEPGEYLNPASPVLTLGRITRPWMRAYIGEKNLGRIKLHQEVDVSTDSYPGKTYKGKVSYISNRAEFTPKIVQTFEERAKLMYRIKVTLENPHYELKPGMPADGRIDWSDQ